MIAISSEKQVHPGWCWEHCQIGCFTKTISRRKRTQPAQCLLASQILEPQQSRLDEQSAPGERQVEQFPLVLQMRDPQQLTLAVQSAPEERQMVDEGVVLSAAPALSQVNARRINVDISCFVRSAIFCRAGKGPLYHACSISFSPFLPGCSVPQNQITVPWEPLVGAEICFVCWPPVEFLDDNARCLVRLHDRRLVSHRNLKTVHIPGVHIITVPFPSCWTILTLGKWSYCKQVDMLGKHM